MGRARGGGEWGARAAAANGAQAQARGEGGREGGSGRLSQNKKSSVGSDVLTPDPVLSPLPPVAGLLHRYYSTCVVWRRPASYASDPRLRSNKSNNAHTLTHLTHSISVYLPPMGVDVVSVYVSVFATPPLTNNPTCKYPPIRTGLRRPTQVTLRDKTPHRPRISAPRNRPGYTDRVQA